MRKIRRSPRANIKERIKEARARSIYLLPNSFTMMQGQFPDMHTFLFQIV